MHLPIPRSALSWFALQIPAGALILLLSVEDGCHLHHAISLWPTNKAHDSSMSYFSFHLQGPALDFPSLSSLQTKLQKYPRISYLRHRIPQSSAAMFIASTILALRCARSASVRSSVIWPISARIVVCASWVMANSASSTP